MALNDTRQLEHETVLKSPMGWSPRKNKNCEDEPMKSPQKQKATGSQRPKSLFLPSEVTLFPPTGFKEQSGDTRIHRASAEESRGLSTPRVNSSSVQGFQDKEERVRRTVGKAGNRVMAAVAALNGKIKEPATNPNNDTKELEEAFEAVLVWLTSSMTGSQYCC
jgi:gas vesicle protein